MRFALIAVLAAGVQNIAAAPALTTIQDTLYKADGSRFEGIAQIEWKTFRAADGSEIPQNIVMVRVFSGQLRITLVPTTNALTAAAYTVRFNSDGRTNFVEQWSVPPSTVPVRLNVVRQQAPVAGSSTTGPSAIADVTGLRTELDVRPVKGSAFSSSRAAVINASGALDGAIGNPEDCIRVDGTSAACGSGESGSSAFSFYIDGETPAGVVDGVNTVFTLSRTPITAQSLQLFRNGILQKEGVGYVVSGSTVTLSLASAPSDVLQAFYRFGWPGVEAVIQVREGEVPAGSTDGLNTNFTLQFAPVPASSLQLYRNGLLQKSGVDFDLAGQNISFRSVAIPQVGDILQATYRY